MEGKREPKRRNAAKTRAKIIATAEEAFASMGYAKASVREIARAAEVAPSLVLRYFESKSDLFEKCLLNAIFSEGVFEPDKTKYGKRTAYHLATDLEMTLPNMIVFAIGDDDARDVVAKVTQNYLIPGFAEWLGPPNANARAAQLLMLTMGFLFYARQLPIGATHRDTVNWLAAGLQHIVDQSADIKRH